MWRFAVIGIVCACGKPESKLDQTPVQLPAVASAPGYCRNTNSFTTTTPVGTQAGSSVKPVHTFSIVARDPVTGDLGVAVQSHWFSVGPLVAWAEPGVGAVATQSFVDPG